MIVDVFNLWNAEIVRRLAAFGFPPLVDTDGCLLGPENTVPVLTSGVPRITFVPLGGKLTKVAPATGRLSPQLYQATIGQPWQWTDVQSWRVDCMGVAYQSGEVANDLKANWDWPSAMMYVVVQSLAALCEGSWLPLRYEWLDSKPSSTKIGGFGRTLSMWFDLTTPVLVYNLPAPSQVSGSGLDFLGGSATATIDMNVAGGSSSDAITINVTE